MPGRLGPHMALRSDKRKMHELIVRCFVVGLLVLLPCHSIQSKPKPHAQLQPCSAVKFDPEKLRRPSPPGCVDMKFSDGSMIVIQYSRPKLRNPDNGGPREVIGFTVPYGQVWRAGANEATSLVTDTNLIIGNASVPAGAYTLYVLPERRSPWKLILGTRRPDNGDCLTPANPVILLESTWCQSCSVRLSVHHSI